MASLTFGGGASTPSTLIPNTFRMKNIQGKTKKGEDKTLVFRNTGSAPLAVVLVTTGRDPNGGIKTLPYSFSINGQPLADKAFIVPPKGKLEFTCVKGVLTSVDGKTPELTTESYLIPEFLLPVFSNQYSAAIVSSALVEAEVDEDVESDAE